MKYVGSISEVEIDKEAMEKDESLPQVFHDDTHRKSPVTPDMFSDKIENKYFKVPKVID
ncbi:MAG: hypothetical protein GY866_07195 [Proteobacteria bacterium]|nr:hypothetical protein [Pseudomonadota bacterium]